jgi:hypothetical protein
MTAARLDDKLYATLQAKAALLGVSLIRSEDERGHEVFIVSKWAMCRQLSNSDEVALLLNRMAGESR